MARRSPTDNNGHNTGGCLVVLALVFEAALDLLISVTKALGRALATGAEWVAHWDLRRQQAKGGVPAEQTTPPFMSWVKAWAAMVGVVLMVVLAVGGAAALAQGAGTTNPSISSPYVSSTSGASSNYIAEDTDTPGVSPTYTPGMLPTDTPVPPTDTPVLPTPTPSGPRIVDAGILGGTLDDFTAAYGQRVSVSGSGQSVFHYTTNSGVALTICLCHTLTGTDGKERADTVGVGLLDGSNWSSLDQRTAVVKTLMPPDAVYVRDIDDPMLGVLHLYQSQDLAATFPANDFYDSGGGGSLPPGTFTVSCDQPNQNGCELLIGS